MESVPLVIRFTERGKEGDGEIIKRNNENATVDLSKYSGQQLEFLVSIGKTQVVLQNEKPTRNRCISIKPKYFAGGESWMDSFVSSLIFRKNFHCFQL